jgi:GT2 family glycosyltransferase
VIVHPTTVTVAISTRNRPDPLGRCLESLAAGERPPDEVVVVDQSADSKQDTSSPAGASEA